MCRSSNAFRAPPGLPVVRLVTSSASRSLDLAGVFAGPQLVEPCDDRVRIDDVVVFGRFRAELDRIAPGQVGRTEAATARSSRAELDQLDIGRKPIIRTR
jgi:hypothetical protein